MQKGFVTRFSGHTERGAALSVVARLDAALEKTLRAWLQGEEKVKDGMFQEMAPLGSLGARVRMGYMLGIYGKPVYSDLTTVAKIRNEFAHRPLANDFGFQKIQNLTMNLQILEIMRNLQDERGRSSDLTQILAEKIAADVNQLNWKFVAVVVMLTAIVATAGRKPPLIPKPML